MEYAPIRDLAHQFSISKKTVYNYLDKYTDKIRWKKEFWKKLVHVEDFTNVFQNQVQSYNSASQLFDRTISPTVVWKPDEPGSKLQDDLSTALQDNERLQKVNANLEDQLSKYGLMLMEEKNERKELLQKYDSLQDKLTTEIKAHTKERIVLIKRYYLLLALCLVVIALITVMLLPEWIEIMSYWQ